jgi:hypothetical protein
MRLRHHLLIYLTCLTFGIKAQNLDSVGRSKPFKLQGGLNIGTTFYDAQNLDARNILFYGRLVVTRHSIFMG